MRAAIYARISEDPSAQARGVTRQREDCEAVAAARGWDVVATFIDNDISALKGQHRPGYEAMMAAVARGEVDWIVAYQSSRLWRKRSQRAEAIDSLSQARVGVAFVRGTDLDLSSAQGRMLAAILGEFDTAESEVKAERVARAALQRAQEGRANGACAYGWRREYRQDEHGREVGWADVIDPAEADVVKGIVCDLLAGVPLRSITARLNAEGKLSPLGKRWIPSSVRKLAVRDLNIGIRRYGDETFPGAWEPIIDEESHARVKALLADPRRRTSRAAARLHLLTFGVGQCGVCDGVLVVSRKGPPGRKAALYVCKERGCVGRRKDRVDELVAQTVCERLSAPDAAAIFRVDGSDHPNEATQLADELRARMNDAADAFGMGQIDREQLARITAKLQPELEAAQKRAQPSVPVPGVVEELLQAADTRAQWNELSVAQQRTVLQALSLTVVIKPARGGPLFKPESVDVLWGTGHGT